MKLLQKGDTFLINNTHKINFFKKFEGYRFRDLSIDKFSDLLGEYVVTSAATEGGGEGHGKNDPYPDGWSIKAEKLDDPNIRISFYQSGCFTTTNKNIVITGKAEKRWIKINQ